ncbi:MAG: diacylglycerol/polyprenol kinase family protein [Candidatus Pacearchaeota archaeon]
MKHAALEVWRQMFHLLFGILIIMFILFTEHDIVLITLFLLFLLSVLFSIIATKTKVPIIRFLLEKFGRDTEIKTFPGKGIIFFIAGCLLTFKLFQQDIALASIAVLTFGDAISTLAGFFGQKYKKKPFSKFKTLYGTMIGTVVSFLVALIFIEPLYAATAAIFGMFIEALAIKLGETEADDNLIVPLASGTACYLLRFVLG